MIAPSDTGSTRLANCFTSDELPVALDLLRGAALADGTRVDVRLRMLFWHLAGRWGRVTRDGITLPLTLTHAVLADLVAARRPTVTTALAELTRRGQLEPVAAGWLLYGDPPGELLAFESPAISGDSRP